MPKKVVWISYDLGLQGDYSGLYSWIDQNKGKECGDSLALIEIEGISDDIPKIIESQLDANVKLTKRDRIYIIYRDDASDKVKGKFIFGGRKRSPWEGYSQNSVKGVEDIS